MVSVRGAAGLIPKLRMNRRLPPVLLAEDEEHDVFFMRRAFESAQIENPLLAVGNGREAIDYLKDQDQQRELPHPGILLLDLKMPLVDGFEVLEWIQKQDRWRDHLPVLVLSSSGEEQDRRKAFELGAHEYLVKPGNYRDLLVLVKDLKRRWLEGRPEAAQKKKRFARHGA